MVIHFPLLDTLSHLCTVEGVHLQIFLTEYPPNSYVSGCHVTDFTRATLRWVPYQKCVIKGQSVHRCPTGETCGLWPKAMFQAVLSLDAISQIVYLYNTALIHNVRGYFFYFSVHITHCWLCKQMKWIQSFQPWQCSWFRVHLNPIGININPLRA